MLLLLIKEPGYQNVALFDKELAYICSDSSFNGTPTPLVGGCFLHLIINKICSIKKEAKDTSPACFHIYQISLIPKFHLEMADMDEKRSYIFAVLIQLIYTGNYIVSKAAFNGGMPTTGSYSILLHVSFRHNFWEVLIYVLSQYLFDVAFILLITSSFFVAFFFYLYFPSDPWRLKSKDKS